MMSAKICCIDDKEMIRSVKTIVGNILLLKLEYY